MTEPTRDRIIAATNELFRRNGYNGTSMAAITTAAGATTGSIYHFFPGGKVELAEAVITETGAVYRQLLLMIAAEAPSAADTVTAFFDGAGDTLAESGYIDLCPIGTVAREVASTNPRLRVASDAVFHTWVDAFAGLLRDEGVGAAEATAVATSVVAAIEGGFVLARVRRDADLLREMGRHVRVMVEAALTTSQVQR